MLKILKNLKYHVLSLLALLILVTIQVMTDLKLPDYMSEIVNKGIISQDNSLIIHTGTTMLLVSLLGGVCAIGVGFLSARIATLFSMNLREKVFTKIEQYSIAEFNQFSTASLITRSTNDIQQIQMVLIMLLRIVLSAPIMGIGAIFKAYHTAPSMSWIMALAVIIMLCIIMVLFSVALPRFKALQKLVDKLNLVTRQSLTGIRVIRAFNNQDIEEQKFDQANRDLTNLNLFVNRLMVIMQPFIMLIFNLTSVLIIWVGAKSINSGHIMIGEILAFMQYAMQVIMSFLMISIIFIMIPRASVSAQRVSEVLETDPQIKEPANPLSPSNHQGLVEFKNVAFSYPGADTPVIENVNFTAKPGETVAIIGSTGSGKSTLINLIPRFYDTTQGQVIIDGVDVKDYSFKELYEQIGYVPQQAILFSGTIDSNIKYGKLNANKAEIKHASAVAQATEFINNLADQYVSPIAQGGTNVSGGQKQRLSIARAVVKQPKILIFDDSFSALDFKTDAALRAALVKEMKDRTVIIVAQRISTIMNADQIIVLNDGRIAGIGRHKELLKGCDVYREIAHSQLSEEELK